MRSLFILTISALQITSISAFIHSGLPRVVRGQGSSLSFGLPGGFGGKNNDKAEGQEKKDEKKITAGGLVQLITAGMGAPFLGDFEGVDKVRCRCAHTNL
jgi:hypothetical protein